MVMRVSLLKLCLKSLYVSNDLIAYINEVAYLGYVDAVVNIVE